MGILRVLFELLVLYLVYKLIFDFIIPVYKTTSQVSRKMSEMQRKMNEQMQDQQDNMHATSSKEKANKPANTDYIEFEEVK